MSDQDRNAIIQVINLYGFAIDSRRWDLFNRVFTADVDACYSDGRHWHDLATFISDFAASHEPYHHTQHAMLNHLVNVSGDQAEAFTYVIWRLILKDAQGNGDLREGSAWYDDDLVRSGGNWLIKRRNCRVTWWQRTSITAAHFAAMEAELLTSQVRDQANAGTVTYLKRI